MLVKISVQALFASKNEGSSNLAKFYWNSLSLLQGWEPHDKGLDHIRELRVSRALSVPKRSRYAEGWLAKQQQDRKMGEQLSRPKADLSNGHTFQGKTVRHIPVPAC